MIQNASPTLSLFYCYAHEDTHLRDELDKHLAMLRQLGWIQSWSDRDISAGTDWQQAKNHHLDTANLLLVLVSADFIHSDYCYGVELQQALQRHQAGEAIVIPILLRPVEWEKTPLSMLQALPRDSRAVTQWDHPDEALKQIATEIRTVVEALRRPVIIVSSPQEQTIAASLVTFFEAHGISTLYIEQALETTKQQEMIRESSSVVLLASSETSSAPLLKEIRNLATLYQRPVSTAWLERSDQSKEQNALPAVWGTSISVDPEAEHQEVGFQELLRHVNRQRHSAAFPTIDPSQNAFVPLSEPRNPYKGLRAFTSDDTRDFFGRTDLIDELARSVETMLTLDQQGKQHSRLLAVVGPSGSGKSSAVMAGLLPCLHAGEVFDSDTWIYLDSLVPGEHPLDALALALFEHFPEKSLQMLLDDLQDETARGLHLYATALARRAKNASSRVVLVVDQFEELFTLTTSEQERQQFINLLVTACTQRGGQLIVILTLRADFYDRPMQYPDLCTLIAEHQNLMLPMALDDLCAVITQPATLPEVQLTFEENLVGDLLFDVWGQIGALPLLQFTLDQLFRQRDGHQLTLSAYHEMGGIKGALSRHAEQTYQALPSSDHRTSARALFIRLIDPGFTEQDTTRRRASLSELTFADARQTQFMQETIEAFVKARLLTTNQHSGRTTVEVSHEAVIREWKRLADWLREAREDIRLQQTISEDATEWEQHNKPGDRLYRGSQLKEAQAWAKRNAPSGNEMAFIHAGAAQHVRNITIVTILMFLLLSTTGIAGWFLTRPSQTYVTTLNDKGPGSLRQAVAVADPGSTIRFDPRLRGKIIMLTSSDLTIVKDLTILGPGAPMLSISNGKSGNIIHVMHGTTVTISGLTFKDSKTNSSSFIYNEGGTLTLSNSIVSNNTAAGSGGGIDNDHGTLTLNNSIISDNMATGHGSFNTGNGGGIDNDHGTLTLNNSTITGNTAAVPDVFDGGNGGGGIYNDDGTLMLNNSTVSGNTTNYGNGGGIFNRSGLVTIIKSLIANNTATSNGGGIFNVGAFNVGNTVISNSCIANNTASNGGGIFNNLDSTIIINNSTISDNTAIGAHIGTGNGGGIFISNFTTSIAKLSFNTIYGNTAHDGGDIAIEDTELNSTKHPKQTSVMLIRDSIVASNPTHPGPNIVGTLTSYGYNLFQNNSGATFDPATRTQHNTDKMLSVNDLSKLFTTPVGLRNNGGPTKTLALTPNSPAVDQIPLAACHATGKAPSTSNSLGTPVVQQYTITTDQRGMKRPGVGKNKCDIGAYEI